MTPHQTSRPKTQKQDPTKHSNRELSYVEYVSSNAKSSLHRALLYICEDNEAVIKMIKKAEVPQ